MGKQQHLVARWNGTSAWHATTLHPVHGAEMSLKLQPRVPQPIQSFWLGVPEFARQAVEDENNHDSDKIAYWYADEIPTVRSIDFSDLSPTVEMTPDLKESLRQIIWGDPTPERMELLTMKPGFESRITRGYAFEVYRPFLKRVIQEEQRFQNRPEVIEACQATLNKLRELE